MYLSYKLDTTYSSSCKAVYASKVFNKMNVLNWVNYAISQLRQFLSVDFSHRMDMQTCSFSEQRCIHFGK